MMSKYEPLRKHLENSRIAQVPMTFAEIESVLGFSLPPSSRRHRAWWSNNPSNSVITYAWLNAGYRTEQVDLEARRLVFRRTEEGGERARWPPRQPGRHPFIGSLKGTVTVAPGVDLAAPADEVWGEIAYGNDS
jgi:hypothetical protein